MYKNILVPVAFDANRDTSTALDVAEAIAEEGAQITALHVMEEIPAYVAQYLPEGQIADNLQNMADIIRKNLGAHEKIKVKVAEGHPAHSIIDYAKMHDIDCVVIASHRPGGVTDFLLGSTAARVVRRAPCSVHVVR
ncbi:MAG: universal stress protein [Rhodobacterales bacterium]|nr:MAG: universal stress protein [Rhodobacterales bacterium]